MVRYLKNLITKRGALPSALTYFVTNRCNLSCRHCFYWKSLNQEKNELSLSEIDKFSRSLGSLMVLNLTGGEPFLRKDFADVARTLIKNLKMYKLIIASNGSLTEKTLQDADDILRRSDKTHVTFYFSIDGIGEDHDGFRGMPGLFEKVVNTIEGVKKLKKLYNNFNVGALLTVHPLNQDKVMDTYMYIRDRIRPDVVSPVLMRSASKELDSRDVDIVFYENLIKQIKKDTGARRLRGHHDFPGAKLARNIHYFKHRRIVEMVKRGHFSMPCFAGLLSGVVYEDGNVAPCEILDYSFGNIRNFDYDFKKLWLGLEAGKITKRIKQTKCFCTYECAMDVNVAFNPKSLLMAQF